MGNLMSYSSQKQGTSTETRSNLDTKSQGTMKNNADVPVCFNCNTTEGRENTSLYPFYIKGEEDKQILCLDCYMKLCGEDKIYVPEQNKEDEACMKCKRTGIDLRTRGAVQARLCEDCIDY